MQKSKKQRMSSRNKYNKQNKSISRKNTSGGSSDENVIALTKSLIKEMKSFSEKSIKKSESPIKTVIDELIDLEKNGTIKESSPKNEEIVMNVISETVEDIEDDAKLTPKLKLKLDDLIDILTKSSFSDDKSLAVFDIIYAEILKQINTQKEKESEIMKPFKDDPRVLSIMKNGFKKDNDLREKTLETLKLKRKELLEIIAGDKILSVSVAYKKTLFQDTFDLFKKGWAATLVYTILLKGSYIASLTRRYITNPAAVALIRKISGRYRMSEFNAEMMFYDRVPSSEIIILFVIAYGLRQRYLKNRKSLP